MSSDSRDRAADIRKSTKGRRGFTVHSFIFNSITNRVIDKAVPWRHDSYGPNSYRDIKGFLIPRTSTDEEAKQHFNEIVNRATEVVDRFTVESVCSFGTGKMFKGISNHSKFHNAIYNMIIEMYGLTEQQLNELR